MQMRRTPRIRYSRLPALESKLRDYASLIFVPQMLKLTVTDGILNFGCTKAKVAVCKRHDLRWQGQVVVHLSGLTRRSASLCYLVPIDEFASIFATLHETAELCSTKEEMVRHRFSTLDARC